MHALKIIFAMWEWLGKHGVQKIREKEVNFKKVKYNNDNNEKITANVNEK